MNEEERKIEEKKEKFKSFFANPYKLGIGLILAIALIIRIYFFNIAKNQAHWWDSLAYGGLAKNMLYHLWNDNPFLAHEAIIRPPFLPWVWSILLRFGTSDPMALFILEIVPSILSIGFIYLIAKELYDERIGLIAAFLGAVSWIHLFYSVRIMTEIPSLFFSLVSIYFFVKGYEELKTKEFTLSILFLALAVMSRYAYGVIAVVYILFLITVHRQHLLKRKGFWIGGIVGSIPLILFFILNIIKYGSLLPAGSVYTQSATEKASFAFYVLQFVPYILKGLFTTVFLVGLVLILWELFIGYDSFNKIKRIRSNLLCFLMLLVNFIFYIFIIRAAEDRYLMIVMPFMFVIAGIAFVFVYNLIKNYSKPFAFIIIIGILLFGAYSQIVFANQIIDNKKESYKQMKDAFEWIKDTTNKDAVIGGDGIDPYIIFYAERKALSDYTMENISDYINQLDYVVLHRFEHQTPELLAYVGNNVEDNKMFSPIAAFFFDSAQTQPAVIIYKVNKS